jgi:RES domain-containing protein
LTVSAWRIATETATFQANDISGAGARATGGRWNSVGVAMLYCSSSIALATLETLSYINAGALPYNRFLVRIEIPDDVWHKRFVLDPAPGGWDAVPAGMTSRRTGDEWVAQGLSSLLIVPSVIVPDENNILINPLHPDSKSVIATTVKRWVYDSRFF